MEFKHISVLKNECIEGLKIRPDGVYVDGTLGGAGHALEVCRRLGPDGRFIGIDQDEAAVKNGYEKLGEFENVTIVRDNFQNFSGIMETLGVKAVHGVLLDLGVSSKQLDDGERGFSYMQDAELDMRMDQRAPLTARDVVNTYPEEELRRILTEYGEERWSARIAEFIAKERQQKPIETTGELVRIIKEAVPKGARQDGPHPAKRSFQALRIEVNHELDILEKSIRSMAEYLAPGGRICIITFHSLEDRIVKQTFRSLENPCTCPKDFPVCICGKKPVVRVITRKPIVPDVEEIEANPRSRSAKLRIAERV